MCTDESYSTGAQAMQPTQQAQPQAPTNVLIVSEKHMDGLRNLTFKINRLLDLAQDNLNDEADAEVAEIYVRRARGVLDELIEGLRKNAGRVQ